MKLFTSIALFLSFSTTAIASDSDRRALESDRGSEAVDEGTGDEEARIWFPLDRWPFPFPSPFPGPTYPGPFDFEPQTVSIDYLGSAEGVRGSHEYDFDVDGELYTVEVRDLGRRSMLALYDEEGEVVVGYVTGERGALIFDSEGVVDRGAAGDIDISVIADYGFTASMLTNPIFLQSFLEAQGEVFEGDDDPPAYWIVPVAIFIAKCVEASVSYSSSSGWSGSLGWDC